MTRPFSRIVASFLFVLCAIPAFPSGMAPDVVLQTMQQELKRATASLAKTDPAPYYLSYAVTDIDDSLIIASNGSIVLSTGVQRRQADVMMRVGSAALDNTHGNRSRGSGITSGLLPLNSDSDAIARVLWQLTDREYEQASSSFLTVKTSKAVQSEEEDKSPDFSQESPQAHQGAALKVAARDQKQWEERARRISAGFLKYPGVYNSSVSLQVSNDRSYLATSDGGAVVRPGASSRLVVQG
jgi:TldD protein